MYSYQQEEPVPIILDVRVYLEVRIKRTFKTIVTGNPSNGMPSWGPLLPKDELYAVTAYIFSIQGFKHVNPPAKAPQGDEY